MDDDFLFSVVDEACARAGFPEGPDYQMNPLGTDRFDKFGPSRVGKGIKIQTGHEIVKETSPRPLDITILHEKTPRFSWYQRFCELRTSTF